MTREEWDALGLRQGDRVIVTGTTTSGTWRQPVVDMAGTVADDEVGDGKLWFMPETTQSLRIVERGPVA